MSYLQQELSEQDQNIDELNIAADRLKHITNNINDGLKDQEEKIYVLETGIDNNQIKMNAVQKKLSKLLQTNDTSQICTILILFGILCVLIFLVFYT